MDGLFDKVVSGLDRRLPRRRLLARAAVAGSALAVAPLVYLTRSLSAMAVVTCSDCRSGNACCDGWTSFCCTLTGSNSCPTGTFMAGWWKCTSYTGSKLCRGQNVRYYVDCNRTPTSGCTCKCANNDCHHRRTCCNTFRYGQCNTEVPGVTEVVCRMVTCTNPSTLFANCNSTLLIDNATCAHEAGCL